jgi:hypothetical protein
MERPQVPPPRAFQGDPRPYRFVFHADGSFPSKEIPLWTPQRSELPALPQFRKRRARLALLRGNERFSGYWLR